MPKKSVKILLSQSQAAGLAGHLAADVLLYPLGKQQNIHAYFPYTYIGTFIVIDFFLKMTYMQNAYMHSNTRWIIWQCMDYRYRSISTKEGIFSDSKPHILQRFWICLILFSPFLLFYLFINLFIYYFWCAKRQILMYVRFDSKNAAFNLLIIYSFTRNRAAPPPPPGHQEHHRQPRLWYLYICIVYKPWTEYASWNQFISWYQD